MRWLRIGLCLLTVGQACSESTAPQDAHLVVQPDTLSAKLVTGSGYAFISLSIPVRVQNTGTDSLPIFSWAVDVLRGSQWVTLSPPVPPCCVMLGNSPKLAPGEVRDFTVEVSGDYGGAGPQWGAPPGPADFRVRLLLNSNELAASNMFVVFSPNSVP